MTAADRRAPRQLPHCCRSQLRHCHGTWIVHRDRTLECTVEGCTSPAEAHELVVVCAEAFTDCDCRTALG